MERCLEDGPGRRRVPTARRRSATRLRQHGHRRPPRDRWRDRRGLARRGPVHGLLPAAVQPSAGHVRAVRARNRRASTRTRRIRRASTGASSARRDNHRARAGHGLQAGRPAGEHRSRRPGRTRRCGKRLLGKQGEADAFPHPLARRGAARSCAGFQLTEFERQSSFLLTGGLAAVHAAGRSREAIWDALQRREVYATSGQKILLWFGAREASTGQAREDGRRDRDRWRARVHGARRRLVQAEAGLPRFREGGPRCGSDSQHLCSGECDNPVRRAQPDHPHRGGEDPPAGAARASRSTVSSRTSSWSTQCPPEPNGCSLAFTDPAYAGEGRDAIYYVRAIEEARADDQRRAARSASATSRARACKAKLCFGDYRSGTATARRRPSPAPGRRRSISCNPTAASRG